MKITESVLREKISRILKEQRKFGRSLEAFIDAFLLTDKYNFQDLGYFGEKIAEIWCKEAFANTEPVSNMNLIKTQNFSFGDVIVGNLDNLSDAIIYSVKATSTNNHATSQSPVKLSSINDMLVKKGKAGLQDELKAQKIVDKQIPITLGLLSIRYRQPTKTDKRPVAEVEILEYNSKFLVVKKEKSQQTRPEGDENQQKLWSPLRDSRSKSKLKYRLIRQSDKAVKELSGYIKTEGAASAFFGPPTVSKFSLDRSEAFKIKRQFNYEEARKERTRLLSIFKDNLSSLSNEDLAEMILQVQKFANKNTNLAESFNKALIRTCLDLLIERKRP